MAAVLNFPGRKPDPSRGPKARSARRKGPLGPSGHEASHEEGETIWLISYADLMTLLFSFFALLQSFSKIDVEAFEKTRQASTEFFGGDFKTPTDVMRKEIQKQLADKGMTDQAFFEDFSKGTTITFRGSLFFDAGQSDLKPEAAALIDKMIPVIKKQPYKFLVLVEGHTDDSPMQSEKFPSNWELSGARAAAVLRLFEKAGFPKSNLRAVGYADTRPVVPNRDANNIPIATNQSQNRRVVIRLIRSDI
jgi:chemotaxis protein MotB